MGYGLFLFVIFVFDVLNRTMTETIRNEILNLVFVTQIIFLEHELSVRHFHPLNKFQEETNFICLIKYIFSYLYDWIYCCSKQTSCFRFNSGFWIRYPPQSQ